MSKGDTRIALVSAFEGKGLPTNVFPDLDLSELDLYVGERALVIIGNMPREFRRGKNHDVMLSALVRALGLGFWSGAAFAIEQKTIELARRKPGE